jgi:putative PEP-CTERM system histidine kinase
LEINLSIGFISYLFGSGLYLLLFIFFFIGIHPGKSSRPFLLLIAATAIWSAMLTLSQIGASIAFEMVFMAELLRYYTWIYVLQTATGRYETKHKILSLRDPLSPVLISAVFLFSFATLLLNTSLFDVFSIRTPIIAQFSWMMFFSVLGLILVEQLFRNTPKAHRWNILLLCISAGAVFIYDFFVFSNALLVQKIDYEFWSARGIVNILIIPTLVIASMRNSELSSKFHVSRKFVFHSTTLITTGLYLLLMSVSGYYIREVDEEWGKVLQSAFLFAAFLFLGVIFFSNSIKTRIKRYLSYSFSNKYDYRDEWNRFSHTLLTPDEEQSLEKRALQAIAQIVDSKGAMLWLKDNNHFVFKAFWKIGFDQARPEPDDSPLITMLKSSRKMISRDEFIRFVNDTDAKKHWFVQTRFSWLVIPLWLNDELFGFIHLRDSIVDMTLDMEDQELLETIAHHVALAISLKASDSALLQAKKFQEMNQMTAFLVHDLKTVLAQLSLLVENGKVHKTNPEFIEDMLNTVEHVTQKMQRLISQLKDPRPVEEHNNVELLPLLQDVINDCQKEAVVISFLNTEQLGPILKINIEEMRSAFKHILQNAIDSISGQGKVTIELGQLSEQKIYITITDTGQGMSQEFVSEQLFQPFTSTKGVSGMGIGAYQSRELFRAAGGDLLVTSETGKGSQFKIELPVSI